MMKFCTSPSHHYYLHIFPSNGLDSLIDAITSLAPLWLVSLSVTPCEGQILGRTIGCHIFYKTRQLGLFLSIVCFQMCPQMACLKGCIVTLVAFDCRIFVCLFFYTIDINWRLVIFTLITIIRVTFAMLHHDMSLQGTLISVCILAKLTFKTFFILHNPSSNDTNNWLTFVFNFFSLKSRKWK